MAVVDRKMRTCIGPLDFLIGDQAANAPALSSELPRSWPSVGREQSRQEIGHGDSIHLPPAKRPECIRQIHANLQPGGIFAFWENNPLNPGTRYVMSKITFDRDAITLMPWEAKNLLCQGGFEILETTFQFIFPRSLSFLRATEPAVCRLPLGAQYLVLARRSA